MNWKTTLRYVGVFLLGVGLSVGYYEFGKALRMTQRTLNAASKTVTQRAPKPRVSPQSQPIGKTPLANIPKLKGKAKKASRKDRRRRRAIAMVDQGLISQEQWDDFVEKQQQRRELKKQARINSLTPAVLPEEEAVEEAVGEAVEEAVEEAVGEGDTGF